MGAEKERVKGAELDLLQSKAVNEIHYFFSIWK